MQLVLTPLFLLRAVPWIVSALIQVRLLDNVGPLLDRRSAHLLHHRPGGYEVMRLLPRGAENKCALALDHRPPDR
jgi:hypothetical protein